MKKLIISLLIVAIVLAVPSVIVLTNWEYKARVAEKILEIRNPKYDITDIFRKQGPEYIFQKEDTIYVLCIAPDSASDKEIFEFLDDIIALKYFLGDADDNVLLYPVFEVDGEYQIRGFVSLGWLVNEEFGTLVDWGIRWLNK